MSSLAPKWQRVDVLAAVFDHLSDALVLFDNDFTVTGVNRAAECLFAMTSEEMLGTHCRDLVQCAICEPNGCVTELPHDLGSSKHMTLLRTPNGRERMVIMRTEQLFDRDGLLEGIVATMRDVSEEATKKKREVVAHSPAMRELMQFVRRIAASEATTILLEGENGTGKDLIAKTIHYQSSRQAEPFVAINCAAIPETLLESELFGYEKGAFTDARGQKKGLFELADKGTLFLDEIGELPLTLQPKLLRAIEEQTFRRLGGIKDIHLDLRVIAATNRDLRDAVRVGAFRQDLYFRLNVIQVFIRPLRERKEDITPLANMFIEQYNQKFKRNIEGMSAQALELLLAYDWPGNVRELRNAIERAMILEETATIQACNLPLTINKSELGKRTILPAASRDADDMSLAGNERFLITRALEKTDHIQAKAARLLGISRDALRYKMKRLNLQ